MSIDSVVETELKGLAEGKEFYWNRIVEKVDKGEVSRDKAIAALKKGLEKYIIPSYKKIVKEKRYTKGVDYNYWKERMKEAKEALKAIKAGKPVKFQDIILYNKSMNNSARKSLDRLANGEEIYWKDIVEMVDEGEISREDAVAALKEGLEKYIIPKYKKRVQAGNTYWRERLNEAKKALKAIKRGRVVEYAGSKL